MLPLDDRAWERFNAALAGRPDPPEGRTEMTIYEGMRASPRILHQRQEQLLCGYGRYLGPAGRRERGGHCQGGEMGGWSLYVTDGAPRFAWNFLGREIYKIVGPLVCRPGRRYPVSSLLTMAVASVRGVMV